MEWGGWWEGKDAPALPVPLTLPHAHCAPVWVTVTAISVETPREVLRAARGRSVTLPCTYRTSVPERKGFIQWDKLLWSHSVRSQGIRGQASWDVAAMASC